MRFVPFAFFKLLTLRGRKGREMLRKKFFFFLVQCALKKWFQFRKQHVLLPSLSLFEEKKVSLLFAASYETWKIASEKNEKRDEERKEQGRSKSGVHFLLWFWSNPVSLLSSLCLTLPLSNRTLPVLFPFSISFLLPFLSLHFPSLVTWKKKMKMYRKNPELKLLVGCERKFSWYSEIEDRNFFYEKETKLLLQKEMERWRGKKRGKRAPTVLQCLNYFEKFNAIN